MLTLVCALVATGILTLTLLTFTVVVLFWENGRVPALASLSVLYLGGTIWLWRVTQKKLRTAPPPFSATLQEFEKDRKWLQEN